MIAAMMIAAALLQPPPKPAEPPMGVETKTVPRADKSAGPPPVAYVIRPRPLPVPLLRVALTPEQSGAGDAFPLYLAAMREVPRATPESSKESDRLSEFADTPPDKLPPEALALLRKFVDARANSLRLTERAVRLKRCDWSPLVPPAPAGLTAAVPDTLSAVQGFRELAQPLRYRSRLRLAAGDRAGALADAGALLALGAHVAEGETMIHYLVGNAVASIGLGTLREASGAGGANLLPALAALPRPLVSLGPAVRREMLGMARVLPPLDALDRKALTPAEASKLMTQARERFADYAEFAKQNPSLGVGDGKLGALVGALLDDPAARRQAVQKAGIVAELVATMPPEQVALLDVGLQLRARTDPWLLAATLGRSHPLVGLPPHPVKPPAPRDLPGLPVLVLTDLLVPAADKCLEAQARHLFDFTALMFAEALRAELARPGAEWGPKLLDSPLVKALPAIEGGKPFPAEWVPAEAAFVARGDFGRRHAFKRGE